MKAGLDWLTQENATRSVARRLLPVTLSLKAMGLALRQVPELNGFWTEGRFQPGSGIHIGFAVSMRGGGLVTPAIHDVDQLSLDHLMARLTDLIPRARTGRMKSSELTDGTCTLTSLGDLGVAAVWGVIYPPQVALVGTGQTALRPWVVDDEVLPRPLMEVTLAADHRASDGMIGAKFLETIGRLLQSPQAL
jgi:pyruvate dehydrogenase E2 component (dihydrolipoamide acetyltransferase)